MHASEDLYEFEDNGAFIVRFCLRRGRRRKKRGKRRRMLFSWRFYCSRDKKKYPVVPSNVPIDNFMLVVSSTVKGNHNCL